MTQTKPEARITPARPIIWLRGISPRSLWSALGLLAVGLILTTFASLYIKAEVESAAQREFDFICNEIQLNVADRLAANAQVLRSSAALFDSSETVTREEWRIFSQKLQIDQHLPGTQGIGFSLLIPREELMLHIEEVRREGFPEYQVKPAGERNIYSSIIYLEPFSSRNLRAFGYDMFSEPVRRAAMELARDENIAALSGKVTLVQETNEDVQAGALMYVPVYRHGVPIDTVEQRRAAIVGWVYSPYRMNDLMRGTLRGWDVKQQDRQIVLQIYDGDVLSEDTLLYDSQIAEDKLLTVPAASRSALTTRLIPVDFAGRRWTLKFIQLGGLASVTDYDSVRLVAFGGTIISLLLFGLTLSLLSTRASAQRIAENLTAELRRWAHIFEAAEWGITVDSADGKNFELLNQAFARMHGFAVEELKGKPLLTVFAPEVRAEVPVNIKLAHEKGHHVWESVHVRKDGSRFPVQIDVTAVRDEYGKISYRVVNVQDITERKQADAAIAALALRNQTLLQTANDGIHILDDQGRVVEANAAFCAMLGYSREEVLQLNVADLDAQWSGDELLTKVRDLLAHPGVFETRHRRKDGTLCDVEINGVSVMLEGQVYLYAAARDITARKQVETELRENRKFLADLIEHSATIIFAKGKDGRYELVNHKYEEITGIPREAIIGHTDAEIFSAESSARYQASDLQVLESGQAVEMEDFINKPPGKQYLFTIKFPLRGDDGNFRGICGISTDITERKQAEERLRASEARYRYLFEQVHDAVFILDLNGHHLAVNQRAADLLGYQMDEILKLSVKDTSAEMNQSVSVISSLLAGEHIPLYERLFRKKDGQIIHAEVNVELVRDEHGEPLHIQSVVRDITERKQVEEEIKRLNASLEQRVEERTQELCDTQEKLIRQERLAVLGQMAGSVGHELRNPLGVMSNAVYFLKLIQVDASAKVKEYLDLIEKNIHISDKIVGDLLDFTRIKSLDRKAVSIPQLVHQTLERFPVPESVRVELDLPAALPQADADPQHVVQILGNLTSNACQAMPQGGQIFISCRTQDGMICITVQDTGAGISPENMKKLFEPLFTTKTKGIGLGLAVCKKLTEANGGSIEAQSQLGTGSIFTLYLQRYTGNT